MSRIWKQAEDFVNIFVKKYEKDEITRLYPESVSHVAQLKLTDNSMNFYQGDITGYSVILNPYKPEVSKISYEIPGIDIQKLGKAILFLGDLKYRPRGRGGLIFTDDRKNFMKLNDLSFDKESVSARDKLRLDIFNKSSALDLERMAESIGVKVR